jgi:hypothetical protein
MVTLVVVTVIVVVIVAEGYRSVLVSQFEGHSVPSCRLHSTRTTTTRLVPIREMSSLPHVGVGVVDGGEVLVAAAVVRVIGKP